MHLVYVIDIMFYIKLLKIDKQDFEVALKVLNV